MPVIEYYLGFNIDSMESNDSIISFWSRWGQGKIEQNELGNWDVIIGDDKVSEIEYSVFKTIMECSETPDIQKYYNQLRVLLRGNLNFRSSCLVKDILLSLEYLMLNETIKPKSPIEVGNFYIFTLDGAKQIICLN